VEKLKIFESAIFFWRDLLINHFFGIQTPSTFRNFPLADATVACKSYAIMNAA
jgi:hypothetical protein